MQSYVDRQFSFDLIFIDADKNNYPHYYELSFELLPSNGIIIIDNMLWGGDVVDLSINRHANRTIRSLNQSKIQKDERVDFSLLPYSRWTFLYQKKIINNLETLNKDNPILLLLVCHCGC